MTDNYQNIISALKLKPLTVEGGFFRETYRSDIPAVNGRSSCGTCIYYLLKENEVSSWHMVSNDEIWLYHTGTKAVQMLLYPNGKTEEVIIGPDVLNGESPQNIIPAGTWQAAKLRENTKGAWGLFGAIVIPGFEYADFTACSTEKLKKYFPDSADKITEFGIN
jgi:hypothetical protein